MSEIEIDLIVEDCKEALSVYEQIFEIDNIEATDFGKGSNEVFFSISGVRFHLLDANPEYGMPAPKPGEIKSIWFNITVTDILATYGKALKAGCKEIQPITEIKDFGVSNAIFTDPFHYVWMLHQVHRVVSFEERIDLIKKGMP